MYWLESNLDFGLFQVPQAFQGMGGTVFQGSSPFGPKFSPDQVLGMERHLYSGQHAPASGYEMLAPFLRSLGFVASPFDRYLYKRTDPESGLLSLLILHYNDFRLVTTPKALKAFDGALKVEFPAHVRDRYVFSSYGFRL